MHNMNRKGLCIRKRRHTKIFGAFFDEHNGTVVEGTCVAIKVVFNETAKKIVPLFASTVDKYCLKVH